MWPFEIFQDGGRTGNSPRMMYVPYRPNSVYIPYRGRTSRSFYTPPAHPVFNTSVDNAPVCITERMQFSS